MTKIKSTEANRRVSIELCIKEKLMDIVCECNDKIFLRNVQMSEDELMFVKSLESTCRLLAERKHEYIKNLADYYDITEIFDLDKL